MKNTDYITVQGWMINELELKGNEIMTYAIIYSFSRDGKSIFSGNASYIANWLNVSKHTIYTVLGKLVERGLIIKMEKEVNGVKLNDYRVNHDYVPTLTNTRDKIAQAFGAEPELITPTDNGFATEELEEAKEESIEKKAKEQKPKSKPAPKKNEMQEWVDSEIDEDWSELMQAFIQYRKEIKDPVKTLHGLKQRYKKLQELSGGKLKTATKILEQTIDKEWKDFYALPDGKSVISKNNPLCPTNYQGKGHKTTKKEDLSPLARKLMEEED